MIRSILLSAVVVAVVALGASAFAEEVSFGTLKSKTPASWKAGDAKEPRIHTFKIPKSKGDEEDAELAVFFFGPGGSGGVDENLKRWKSFFEAPKGKSPDDIAKVETFKVGKAALTYLDISGVYLSKFPPFAPNAKVTRKANYRMLAVIFDGDNGPYFVRLTGPAATIAANKSDFDAWLKNFK